MITLLNLILKSISNDNQCFRMSLFMVKHHDYLHSFSHEFNTTMKIHYTIQYSMEQTKNHKQYYKLHNIQSSHTCKQFQHFNIHRCARISSLYLLNWEKISTGILLLKHNASHQYLGIGLK